MADEGEQSTTTNFQTYEFWKEPAADLYNHLDSIRNLRDGLCMEVEMLHLEWSKTKSTSIFKKLTAAGEKLRALHIHYLAVSTHVCKRDRGERQKPEEACRKEYLETYNIPFLMVANAEKEKDEADQAAAAARYGAANIPAAAIQAVVAQPPKLSAELRPDLAHAGLTALEFEEWKNAAQIWAEVSGFKETKGRISTAYLARVVEPALWVKARRQLDTAIEAGEEECFDLSLRCVAEVFYSINDIFCLRLKCKANRFAGTNSQELLEWFYIYKAEYLNAKIDKMETDDCFVFEILSNAPKNIQKELLAAHPKPNLKTVLEFLNQSITINNMSRATGQGKSGKVADKSRKVVETGGAGGGGGGGTLQPRQGEGTPFTGICHRCGNQGHKFFRCKEPKENLKCSHCKTEGSHNSTVCRREAGGGSESSADRQPRRRRESDSSPARSPRPDTRSASGRSGTPAPRGRDSSNAIIESKDKMAMKWGELQPVKAPHPTRIRSLCDSGSTTSLVNSETLRQMGGKVHSAFGRSCNNASGENMAVAGQADIFIRLDGMKYKRKISFLVVDDLEEEVIVGLQDLKKIGLLHRNWPHVSSDSDSDSGLERDRSAMARTWWPEGEPEKPSTQEGASGAHGHEAEEEQKESGVTAEDLCCRGTLEDIPEYDQLPDQVKSVLEEFRDVFTNKLTRETMMNIEPVKFNLKPNASPRERIIPSRPIPAHYRERAYGIIDELLDGGYIKPVQGVSRYISPAIFMPKPHDKSELRLCIDYKRTVNDLLERPQMGQCSPEDVVKEMDPGNKLFFTADLKSAYFQIPLAEGERGQDMTTFAIPGRSKYKWCVLPQGIRPAGDLLGEKLVEAFMPCGNRVKRIVDDIIGGARSIGELCALLKLTLERCRMYSIHLSAKKFKWGNKVIFGGLEVSDEGVRPDPERLRAVSDLREPTCREDVRRILGLLNTLSSYSGSLAMDNRRLRDLLRRDRAWNFGEEERREFNNLKTQFSNVDTLSLYDKDQALGLDVDTASCSGVGYLVYNYDKEAEERGRPREESIKLIRLGSISAKKEWSNYSALETESTGCLHVLRKMSYFVAGAPEINLRVDHRPLAQAWSNKDLDEISPRMRKIFLEMREYAGLKITWKRGEEFAAADALSRAPVSPSTDLGEDPLDNPDMAGGLRDERCFYVAHGEEVVTGDPMLSDFFTECGRDKGYIDAVAKVKSGMTKNELKKLPVGCYAHALQEVWDDLSIISNEDGVDGLTVGGTRLVVPDRLRKETISVLDITHSGFKKAWALASMRWYFPGIRRSLASHTAACQMCLENAKQRPKEEVTIEEAPHDVFERVSWDGFEWKGVHYVMAIDHLSSYARYYRFTKSPSSRMIKLKMNRWGLDFGFPREICSDGAGVFVSEEMKKYYADIKVVHRLSSATFAQSNGKVERCIQSWKDLRAKAEMEGKSAEDFEEVWALFMLIPQEAGELSPARMAFRRNLRHPKVLTYRVAERDTQVASQDQFERKNDEKRARNLKHNRFGRKPLILSVGRRVLVLDKSGKFSIAAKIVQIRPSGRSCYVRLTGGRILLRNRKFLQVDASEPDSTDEETDRVNVVNTGAESFFRSVSRRNKDGKTFYTMEKTIMRKPLTPCMKGSNGGGRSGCTVRIREGPCCHAVEVRGFDCGGKISRPGHEISCCCKEEARHKFKCDV
jgi:hypothetical protein